MKSIQHLQETWTLVRELSYQMDREQSYQYTCGDKEEQRVGEVD
jgi:hypothetical protein